MADGVLFPAALEVDRTGTVPDTHWAAMADAGLYGIAAPSEHGGPGLALADIVDILEVMAGGCLATAFTWIQHHGMVLALASSRNTSLRDEMLPGAVAGRIKGGVAYAGAVPVPPRMRAARVNGGWRMAGHAPFVSGWGVVDVLQISAGDVDTGDIVAGLVAARSQPGLVAITPQDLCVADASRTVSLDVDGLVIPDERIVSRVPRAEFMANQNFGSRLNATLPIGVVRRCARLLEQVGQAEAAAAFRHQSDAVRRKLDAGLCDSSSLLEARADGCALATRAAAAVVAAFGGQALLRTSHAQLLARWAAFTLVAASRPELKRSLVSRMANEARALSSPT